MGLIDKARNLFNFKKDNKDEIVEGNTNKPKGQFLESIRKDIEKPLPKTTDFYNNIIKECKESKVPNVWKFLKGDYYTETGINKVYSNLQAVYDDPDTERNTYKFNVFNFDPKEPLTEETKKDIAVLSAIRGMEDVLNKDEDKSKYMMTLFMNMALGEKSAEEFEKKIENYKEETGEKDIPEDKFQEFAQKVIEEHDSDIMPVIEEICTSGVNNKALNKLNGLVAKEKITQEGLDLFKIAATNYLEAKTKIKPQENLKLVDAHMMVKTIGENGEIVEERCISEEEAKRMGIKRDTEPNFSQKLNDIKYGIETPITEYKDGERKVKVYDGNYRKMVVKDDREIEVPENNKEQEVGEK